MAIFVNIDLTPFGEFMNSRARQIVQSGGHALPLDATSDDLPRNSKYMAVCMVCMHG